MYIIYVKMYICIYLYMYIDISISDISMYIHTYPYASTHVWAAQCALRCEHT